MKKFLSFLFVFFVCIISMELTLFASDSTNGIVPPRIAFDVKLATSGGLLEGVYFVTIRIGSRDNILETGDMSTFKWIRSYSDVMFSAGVASFVLGDDANPIEPADLSDSDTIIHIEVDGLTAAFPLPSVPYSIYSQSSLHAEEILAENIIGAFITTVNVVNDLIVSGNALYVDYTQQNVGIGKKPSLGYSVDVDGTINAAGYFIDGQSIESIFSWQRRNLNTIYYDGSVGIGLTDPDEAYQLHVSGNVSATDYYIEKSDGTSQRLQDYLEGLGLRWQQADSSGVSKGIYYDLGNVAIGTSELPVESLVVSGAIKIGQSIQASPLDGTIEYKNGDFFGYVDGDEFSLTGLKLASNSSFSSIDEIGTGLIPYFVQESTGVRVDATENFRVSINANGNFVGVAIGTDNVGASLTISGDGNSDYLEVLSDSSETLFIVDSQGNVGVGTSNVGSGIMMSVDGVVNAGDFFKNGQPLSNSLAENSFWKIGETNYGNLGSAGTDLFYEAGYVGIGTSTPKNMLELSSAEDRVALTFDINDQDLFSLGIDSANSEAFIISQGSDLSDPVFSFERGKIGIGLNDPTVSLHVSGNAGFLVEGRFDSSFVFDSSIETVTGSAMFYFPVRSAFRAGYASSLEWNVDNLGDYSTSFGYNNTASGNYSFIGGGYENIAGGEYSVVPGGMMNKAQGDYSFAAGYYAEALHDGTFVWSDVTVSENSFASLQKNQFLVRAYGGVGINTNQTEGSAFVVQNDSAGNILDLKSSAANDQSVVVSSEGQVLIGDLSVDQYSSEADLKLGVNGRVGIGNTVPQALLHIENSDSNNAYLMYVKGSDAAGTSSNVFVITNTGNVGIGTDVPNYALTVSGSVKADAFFMVDPNDPSAVIKLEPAAGSPFTMVQGEGSQSNAYRTQGFIGLGTMTPNSLLELSNQNDEGSMPVITFDYNNSDVVKMGLITSNTGVFFAIAPTDHFTSENATFIVTNNSVVIGRGVVDSNYSLDVSGNVFVDGKFAVATDNVHADYDVFVNGLLAVSTLNINGEDFSISGQQNLWKSNGSNLYSTDNYNVAIGTDNANEALVVDGAMRVFDLHVSANQLALDGNVATKKLLLQDQVNQANYGELFVDSNGDLVFMYDGLSKSLTSPLQTVFDSNQSGPLAFWVDASTISYSPIYWDSLNSQLAMTSNLVINNYESQSNGLVISTNISFLDDVGMQISTDLDHQGEAAVADSYSLYKLDLNIEEDWGNPNKNLVLKGLDLNIANGIDDLILNNAAVVGVYVDVTSVNVGQNQRGNVYAAKFLGGNVGIGVTEPSEALEVAGVVSANYVNLASGFEISELTINEESSALIVKDNGSLPAVGIGVADPREALEVAGVISANEVFTDGIAIVTLNVGNGAFYIDATGNIGIGTMLPSASFEINHTIDANFAQPYIGEKIVIEIDGVDRVGQEFYFSQDLTAFHLDLDTLANSQIANNVVKGIDIDLVSVNLTADSKLYGLYVDVDNGISMDNRYAAVFMGGNVGIGTANPTVALDVNGSIKADNLYLSGALVIEDEVTIKNDLSVDEVSSLNRVTINQLAVNDTFYAKTVAFDDSDITVVSANFGSITANYLTVQSEVTVSTINADYIDVNSAIFREGLAVGTTDLAGNILNVNGAFRANSATFRGSVEVPTFSVDNGDTLYVGNSKVGIGTNAPDSALHVVSNAGQFDVSNIETWNALKFGVNSNVDGQTVGLLFSPDSQVSTNIGSGILAFRNSTGKSSLVFITDPYDADPNVSMLISSEGTVGIGDLDPLTFSSDDKLYVDGTATFTDDVSIDRLAVANIYSKDGAQMVISANEGFVFNGDVEFDQGLTINNGLIFNTSVLVPPTMADIGDEGGYLYVYNNDLYFINNSVSRNLSSVYTGTAFKIPYFDQAGNVKDVIPLSFEDNTFVIGDDDSVSTFKIESIITDNSVAVQEIRVTFDRLAGSSSRYTAFEVAMNGADDGQESGRLGNNDTAVGLSVDLTGLQGTNKYAAIFNGGNVGIGVENPTALLHIQDSNDNDLVRVDGTDGYSVFTVTNTGNIGIGTAVPTALFEIDKPVSYSDYLLKIVSDNKDLLLVSSNGDIAISGVVSANQGVFNVVSANALSIANGLFFVSSNGDIAIGTDNVGLGSVAIFKELSSTDSSDYIGEKLDVTIDFEAGQSSVPGGDWSADYTYVSDLTGFSLVLETAADNVFGGSSKAVQAAGVSINLSGLTMDTAATAYGLYVDVGDEVGQGGTRYGAYFNGNVGIGEQNPTYALTVDGSIYSTGLIVESGSVSINILTVNSMVVDTTLDVAGDVLVTGKLTADTITVNKLVVNQTAEAASGVYDSVTVNTRLYIPDSSQLIVGTDSGSFAGSADYLVYVSGNVTVNGTLEAERLYVNKIQAQNGSTVNIAGIVSANHMISGKTISTNMLVFDPSVDSTNYPDHSLYAKGDDLYFGPVSLTSFLTGQENAIPVYKDETLTSTLYPLSIENLSSSEPVSLTLGGEVSGDHSNLGLRTVAQVTGNNFIGHLVNVTVNGVTSGTKTYTGYKMRFSSDGFGTSGSPSSWGRLSEGDVAIGLHVDMNSSLGDYPSIGGSSVTPKKYAGLFSGGLVGIGTSEPEAALHVVQYENYFGITKDIFRVDSLNLSNPAFLVDELGQVGINTADPEAQFTISGDGLNRGLFLVSSNAKILFSVTGNAVGIGTEGDASKAVLSVSGNALFQDSSGTNVLMVSSNRVAIGHSAPAAMLDIQGGSSTSLLRINNGNKDVLFVDQVGGFYFGEFDYGGVNTTPLYDFNVISPTSAIVLVTDSTNPFSETPVPTKILTGDSYGYMTAANDVLMFMGSITPNESVIMFGGEESSTLTIVASKNTGLKDVMSITDSGVGILTDVNSNFALAVDSTFSVGTNSFIVNNSGQVGINTASPQAKLHVDGKLIVDALEVVEGGITITTLNVNGQMIIEDDVDDTKDYAASLITVNLGIDSSNHLYGMRLMMQSAAAPETDEDPFYLMAGNADAYGLYVDMSDLAAASGSSGTYQSEHYGNKYAAVFKGGAVGIGTTMPDYPLEVVGESSSIIAGFGGIGGNMVIRDWGQGAFGWNVINESPNSNLEHVGITILPSIVDGSGFVPALVGIGTTNPDKALVVNGDMRIGVLSNNPIEGQWGRYGSKLFFSGGPSQGLDSDNGDDLWIARYNASDKASRLRVNFSTIDDAVEDEAGIGNGSDMFVVGYTQQNTYHPVLKVHNNSKVTIWGDENDKVGGIAAIPDSTLYVRGSGSSNETPFGSYTALLERSGSEDSGVLALAYDISSGTTLGENAKFVGFYNASNLVGSIEGNGNGGVRYVTTGADYAEYLEKKDKQEIFEKGDIVAVVNGVITKDTRGFQQLMVLSSAAAVAGNWPRGSKEDFELVSFYGQVPTKVRGKVVKGDFIIAGFGNDGVGVAKSVDSLTLNDRTRIVGRAWESSRDRGVKLINTAVGFAFGHYSLNDEMEQLNEINNQLDSLQENRDSLLAEYQKTFEKQSEKIESLLLKLEKSR